MAILNTTITKTEPASIVAGENPIILTLGTGTVGSPSAAQTIIKVQQAPSDGLKLTFNLTEPTVYTKVFTAKAFPNQDDYFFANTIEDREGSIIEAATTKEQVAGSLADCFAKDVILSRYYFINYTGGSNIYLISKEKSARFNLTGKIASSNNAQVTYQHVSSGASQFEGSTVTDYSLFAEVWMNEDAEYGDELSIADFNRVTELVLPFSPDNIHRFDVSQIAKAFVSTPMLDLSSSGATVIPEYIVPMFFRYGEQYPVVPNETTKKKFQKGISSFIWVANAALDHTSANDLTSFTGTTDNRFLNTSPSPKKTSRQQQEFLYLLIPKDNGRALRIKADLQYWDGSVLSGHTLYSINTGDTNAGGLYAINVSHAFHLASLESTKRIKTASIYIMADVSEEVIGDERLVNNSFTNDLVFLNSWGQSGSGATWTWNSGSESADAELGITTGSTTTFVEWLFTEDMEEWVSSGGGSQSTWAYSEEFGGSVKNTTIDVFGTQSLVYEGVSFPQQPFKIRIGYVMPEVSSSSSLVMGFIIRDQDNNQLFNQGIASFGSGSELFKEFEFDASDSAIWENGWQMQIYTTSTGYNAGDELYITSVEILLEEASGTTVTTTSRLEQRNLAYIGEDNLNLEPVDYDLRYDVTFGAGSGTDNKLYVAYYDEESTQIGSDVLLYEGGSGNVTGTSTISGSIAPDIFKVSFWVENQEAPNQTVSFNEFSIIATEATTSGYTEVFSETRSYAYPYSEPLNRFGVVFLNKLGVWETFDFIGLKEETLDRESKVFTMPVQPNADGSYPRGFKINTTYDVKTTRRIVVNSGWLDKEHFNWLDELLQSNTIYSYSDDTLNYLVMEGTPSYSDINQNNERYIEVTFIHTTFEKNVSI